MLNGAPARLIPYRNDIELPKLAAGDVLAGAPDTTMRAAIEVHHTTGRAMPLLDEQHRLIGVIGTAELLSALLHRGAGLASGNVH